MRARAHLHQQIMMLDMADHMCSLKKERKKTHQQNPTRGIRSIHNECAPSACRPPPFYGNINNIIRDDLMDIWVQHAHTRGGQNKRWPIIKEIKNTMRILKHMVDIMYESNRMVDLMGWKCIRTHIQTHKHSWAAIARNKCEIYVRATTKNARRATLKSMRGCNIYAVR